MFNGHRTIEHEENVVRIVNFSGEKESENGSIVLLKNNFFFFSKAIAC